MKPCILIPTYNNPRTLKSVVLEAKRHHPDVLVVNDGSDEPTKKILSKLHGIHLIEHKKNRGKGAALQTGFLEARKRGFTHVITLDSDGQHLAKHIHHFKKAASQYPDALLLGDRNLEKARAGFFSRAGRWNSNFWTTMVTGLKLPDTQTGFRCYPLEAMDDLHTTTTGFDFEYEVLIKAAWNGIPIHSIPIEVRYFTGEDRVSHLNLPIDFLRFGRLYCRLLWIRRQKSTLTNPGTQSWRRNPVDDPRVAPEQGNHRTPQQRGPRKQEQKSSKAKVGIGVFS